MILEEPITMTLLKYDPFSSEELPTGLKLFQDSISRMLSEPGIRPWTPGVDIVETSDELVVKADVPGVDLKDIDIRIENGTLTLKGERKFEKADKANGYHRIERSYGAFARSFALPDTVDPDKVRADFKDGVLTVTLAKKELAKPRTIKVEVNS